MDPVTAFSLAAGVLQVVDFSLKALGKCREIYKDGSLAQHRQTEEITKSLADTSERLRNSTHSAPTAASKESEDVIDLSNQCSATAEELISELKKLQLDPRDSFFKAVKTGVRAFRRKKFLTDTEGKLQKYQTILNTRILSRLDVHAIQQIEKSQQLDQHVRNLAKALAEGHNTVIRLLSDQAGIIQGHIDRHFDNQAQREAKQRVWRDFKKTLFFPEILARRDNIARSHDGTCRWILRPHEQRSPSNNDQESDDGQESDYDQNSDGDQESDVDHESDYDQESVTTELRVPPESNFVEWLKKGEHIYWLNGKPGAGKSTLMKYVSTEVPKLHRSGQALSDLGIEADLMACSFFFWSLGAPLQKNYVGFIRSLLYQIAEQRDNAIPILMGNDASSTEHSGVDDAEGSAPSYMWTVERLDDALRRFLDKKPASLRFYVFLDGLDEFEGDEDPLLETIRLLAQTPGTRVCVSSRPEQIFRQGFAKSPQLRLQDFNHYDIERASRQHLEVTLAQYFPDSPQAIRELIQDVARKASGIFLWADLMNKVIKRGAINGDTLRELRERLGDTPETIDGLYQDILTRLDKKYLRDAARYMHMLLIDGEQIYKQGLTLLHFACLEQSTWDHKLSEIATYDQSEDFDRFCAELETRILARCGGLVEIDKPAHFGLGVLGITLFGRPDDGRFTLDRTRGMTITRNLRPVRFIHKTAAEFVRKHDVFVKDPKWSLAATRDVTRSWIEGLAHAPLVLHKNTLEKNLLEGCSLHMERGFMRGVLTALSDLNPQWPFEEDHRLIRNMEFDTINRVFDVLDYVFTSLKVPDSIISSLDNNFPLRDRLGCAAYFGCHDYIRRCVMPSNCGEEVAENILECALTGLFHVYSPDWDLWLLSMANYKVMLDFASQSRSEFWHESGPGVERRPRWLTLIFLLLETVRASHDQSLRDFNGQRMQALQQTQLLKTWKLVLESILDHNVDVNYLLTVPLMSKGVVQRHDPVSRIWLETSESILSTLKRDLNPPDLAFREDILELLETHGATYHSHGIAIGRWANVGEVQQLYRLTGAQSEKFLQLPWERFFRTRLDDPWYRADIVEVRKADQPLPEAEELLDLLCQEAEHLGSIIEEDY